jgi:hypothetical protein
MPSRLDKNEHTAFREYAGYVSELMRLMEDTSVSSDWQRKVDLALNGQPNRELRRLSSLQDRRYYGTYFTGPALGDSLLANCTSINQRSIFYDPSCGMGDLLLAAARRLPLAENLAQTVTAWGKQLAGTDLHVEFIRGVRTRLVLLARKRLQTTEVLTKPLDEFFPKIKVGDGFVEQVLFRQASTVLMNAPFRLVQSPVGCSWASGLVSQAGLFAVTALERVRPGIEVLAILPEVLRSGTFSEHWRNRISELAEVSRIVPCGVFDGSADVDVFSIKLVKRAPKARRQKPWPKRPLAASTTVADHFDVHVGKVVPHRDRRAGREYAYIHPRCVPTWKMINAFSETRRHSGNPFQAPFVVIRRTSRVGDKYRATASIIGGDQQVAVENHLIVCLPKDKTTRSCKSLMRHLKTKFVNEFLDDRIRCRHLTVGAVMAIPFHVTTGRSSAQRN